jgi:hypothetical protein
MRSLGSYKTSKALLILHKQTLHDVFLSSSAWKLFPNRRNMLYGAVTRGRDYDIVRVWTGWISQALDWPETRPVIHFLLSDVSREMLPSAFACLKRLLIRHCSSLSLFTYLFSHTLQPFTAN